MPTSRFKVVVCGDSILQLGADLLYGWQRMIDVEGGRQLHTKGNEGRWSAEEACELLIPMVAPGGYFVFQDNGANVTQAQWRSFLQEVVDQIPVDVCLIGVLPIWVTPATPSVIADTAAKANIMVQEFGKHTIFDWIRWNQQVAANPALVYDGQHPTQAGREWLAAQLNAVTGTQAGGPP